MRGTIVDVKNITELNKEFTKYDDLINYYKQFSLKYFNEHNIYCEKHHIIPRCEGGNNDESNLIYLNVKHHLLAHFLRAREEEADNKLYFAWKNYLAVKRICTNKEHITIKQFFINLDETVEAKEKYIKLFHELDPVWITNGKKSKRIPKEEAESFILKHKEYYLGRTFTSPANKVWVTDGTNRDYVLKENLEQFMKKHPNWKIGMGPTKKHNIKDLKSLGSTRGLIWVNKDGVRKNIKPEELSAYENDGWTKGSGNSFTNQGKRGIHKGNLMINVPASQLDEYLNKGWTLGRTAEYSKHISEALKKSFAIKRQHLLPENKNQAQGD